MQTEDTQNTDFLQESNCVKSKEEIQKEIIENLRIQIQGLPVVAVNVILVALGKLPYEQVNELCHYIKNQAQEQVDLALKNSNFEFEE